MMISKAQIQSILGNYTKQTPKVNKVQPAGPVKGKDSLVVSKDARDYMLAKAAIAGAPEIREEKVARLETMVRTGTYEVKDEDIAEKMIGRSLVDELI